MAERLHKMIGFALFLLVPAIIYSKALITICYVMVLLGAVAYYSLAKKHSSNYGLMVLALVFIAVVLSGVNSDNISQWQHHVLIKLPFGLLPLCFLLIPKFDARFLFNLHLWLAIVLSVSAVPVILEALLHGEMVLDNLAKGIPISTPVEHVKYSMFLSYGVISSLILGLSHTEEKGRAVQYSLFGMSFFLFLALHAMAVRTGLFISYISIVGLLIYYLQKRHIGIVGYLVILIAFLAMMRLLVSIPTVHQKIAYMTHDWKMYQEGTGGFYSDSERIYSLQLGTRMFLKQPVLGVGIGDLKDHCEAFYRRDNRQDIFNYPHSQFIYLLSGMGLLGFVLTMVGFYGIWLFSKSSFPILLIMLYVNYSLSFIVENSLERSISVAFFLLFACVLLHSKKSMISL